MRDSRPTIIDIAKVAGVSFKTVSRVLNDNPRVASDLRERVLKAAADLNYRPNIAARSLASARSYAIAMLISSESVANADAEGWYLPPFVMDLQARALLACQELGYRFYVAIVDLHEPLDEQLSTHRLHIDGAILAPPIADKRTVLEALERNSISYVRIAPGIEPERSPAVRADEYGGAFALTQHLLSLGHRRFGFVHGPANHLAAAQRHAAFQDALAAYPDSEAVSVPGDFTFTGGIEAGESLLSLDRPPTAIFAANDEMGAGVIAVATSRGIKVPDALSVVGFDDSLFARMITPPLTTVHQPITEMVGTATKILAGTIAVETPPQMIELPCRIIERGSTARPDFQPQ